MRLSVGSGVLHSHAPTAAPSSSSSSRLPSAAVRPRALRRQHTSRLRCTAVAAEQKTEAPGLNLLKWLKENGAPQDKVELKTMQVPEAGRPLDVTVAASEIKAGDVALSVPQNLVVTLDRIFESEGLAEMLTAGKLSELACLTLYMMYEKKVGQDSFWYQYIKELDRQRARGVQAVESPLLWSDEELADLLQGSPVVAAVRQRIAGIEKEYNELDAVWFMAGSLFNKYPFDIPSEAFTFLRFKQAFAAIQASIVHLQGVALARRFALVPLGPPLLSYSSTAKATFKYNPANQAVELVVDRDYQKGDPVYAWCGPQPNTRLLINYGIVDESNPYDKLQLIVTLPNNDPHYKLKRGILQEANLSTMQTFDLKRSQPLPPMLLPYLRLAFATSPEQINKVQLVESAPAFDDELEQVVACQLAAHLQERMAGYKHPLWRDLEIVDDPKATPRQKIAARLTKIEKSILQGCMDAVTTCAPCLDAQNVPKPSLAVKFSQ